METVFFVAKRGWGGGGGGGKGYSPRRSMRRPRKLGTTMRQCDNATLLARHRICGVLRRKFWQVSRLVRSSCIQRCRSFSERVSPRIIFLKASQVSSCSKRSREITAEPMTKNRV